ncbi:MAG: cyclase family protein [Chloroflexi bacterium]|nr:cyclase family protein [Chloroflexota bacterium]
MLQCNAIYDLTHPMTPQMYHPTGYPKFTIYETLDGEGCLSSRIDTSLHMGTHMDAPVHVMKDGLSIGEIAPARLVGPALVVDVSPGYGPDCGKNLAISAADLQAAVTSTHHSLDAGDMIIVNTGWHRLYTSEPRRYYSEFSTLSAEAGRWLAEKGVIFVGVDCCDADEERFYAKPPYAPPNHKQNFLSKGICICENVGGDVDKVLGKKLTLIVAPLRIVGPNGNASPIRLLAVE